MGRQLTQSAKSEAPPLSATLPPKNHRSHLARVDDSCVRRAAAFGLSLCLLAGGALLASPAASASMRPRAPGGPALGAPTPTSRQAVVADTGRQTYRNSSKAANFTVSPATLPASGGSVRLSAVVQRSATCRFSSATALPGLPATKPCTSGRATVSLEVPSNTAAAAREYVLNLTAWINGTRVNMRGAILERAHKRSVAPTITLEPTSQSVFSGTHVTLAAKASGEPRPHLQWQSSTNGGASWSNVAGATSTNWSFTAKSVTTGYVYFLYRAVFANSAGTAATTTATLTVSAAGGPGITKGSTGAAGAVPAAIGAPIITTQPTNQTVAPDSYVTLSAAASGNPTPSVQWQVSTDGGGSWTNTDSAFVATASENGYEYRAVFTNTAGSAITDTVTLTVLPVSNETWAGYVATGSTFSTVTGSWTVPTLTCPAGVGTMSSEWVGIDGFGDATVEQDGVEADCDDGVAAYFAWYEMYGDPYVENGYAIALPAGHAVSAGDVINATVSLSGSSWLFTVADTNTTSHWTFETGVAAPSPAPAQSSAEWIVEDPDGCDPQCQTLSDFSPVRFTGATATADGKTGPISSFPLTALQITGGPTVFTSPGALDTIGEDFTDTWYAN